MDMATLDVIIRMFFLTIQSLLLFWIARRVFSEKFISGKERSMPKPRGFTAASPHHFVKLRGRSKGIPKGGKLKPKATSEADAIDQELQERAQANRPVSLGENHKEPKWDDLEY